MRGKLLIALAFLFCLAGPAFAADRPDPPTFRLVPQDYTTIQAAIDAAIDGDVVMVSPGVYFGVGNRDLDLGGKAITVRSAGDPASCIIDCEGLGRGFIFRSGEGRDSMIEGLTIMGGYHNSYGGGIECEFASPTIYNCIIMDCSAYDGGGIDCYGASPLIRDCIISGNSAENNGGGIECYSNSYPEITNCLIESNVAGHFGGAIDSYSSQPVITNCTFVGNAYSVIHSTTDFTIVNCILWNDNSTTELSGCSAVYSCVRGGAFGEGNISTDPQFRTGPLGDYYLRQSDAGQLSNSDCLDAGDPLWSMTDLGLDGYTTRTDSVADSTIVDMGYHYPDGGPIVVYDLDASVAGTLPNGQIQVSPSSGPYNEFSEVRFTANPDVGYKMLKWTGTDDDTSTSTSNVVTMTSDKTVTVEFTPRLVYTLTTLVSDGEGSISPASGPYYEGDWVELTAVPDDYFVIKGWTGTNYDSSFDTTNYVYMDSDKTVSVEFMTNVVRLNARAIGAGWVGEGVSPRRGVYTADHRDPNYPVTVTLTAQTAIGYKVKQWTGTNNDSSRARTNTVTMRDDKDVTVEFEPARRVWLATDVIDSGNGQNGRILPAPPGQWVYEEQVVPLLAIPNPDYEVRSWSGIDPLTDPNLITVTMTPQGAYVTVEFKLISSITPGMVAKISNTGQEFITIQAAIDKAIDGDVVLVAEGTHSGAKNYDLDFGGKNLTVQSEFDDPAHCTINCGGLGRAFNFHTGESGHSRVSGFTIINGSGRVGGAIRSSGAGPTINNCVIRNCSATINGGAIWFNISGQPADDDDEIEHNDPNYTYWPDVSNCVITGNTAGGDGGAIYCNSSSAIITNTVMSGNQAGDRGGAVACLDNSHSEIVNCLITDNHAVGNGGGVFFRNSYGIVNLTTIVENVSDNEGRGGIAGRNQGQNLGANRITVTNSIVWNNGILGDNIDDLWSDPATMMDATFTCSGNAGDVTAQNDNISEDPMFVDGPLGNFYLYHPVSDCINAGEGAGVFSTILNTYNLDGDITTDPESSPGSLNDLRSIDMGYHYKPFAGVRMQRLEIHVVNDLGGVEYSARFGSWPDPSQYVNGGGIATYGNPIVMYFPQGTYVNLTAIPDPGYRISSWQGSGNDAQLGNFNYVYIGNTDAVITVEFEVKHTNIIHVPGVAPFIGIQGAIDIARDGDIIIIAQGIYVGTDFVVSGKDITITGTAPEKPEIVAQTVINCSGGHRGFTLLGTGQGSCTLRGLTIVNAGGGGSKIPSTPNRPGGTDGLDAGLNMGAGVYVSGPHIVADCVIRSCYVGGTEGQDGTNGQYPPGNPGHEAHGGSGGKGGTVAGGGIYVSWGSAQILRCTIDGCLIRGGRGADGSNGASGSDDDMRYISWGGTGGYGGGAYGGGICIDQWARGVLIEDSTITNCRAVGGVGGNGGNGGNRADGGDAGAPGPAFGGGIYVAQGADVSIEGTSMEGCEAVGGLGGDGGERDGAAWPGFGGGTPYDPLQGDPTQYTAKGGGLYYEDYSTATIRDCTFSGNIVRGSVTGVGELFAGGHREEPQKNYQLPGYGAGMFVGDYSHVTVTNCSFSDNLADLNPNPGDESAPVFLEYFIEGYIGYGGGVCFEGISVANTHVSVDGSYFSGNDSQIGGGLYAAGCDLDVHNSSFVGNKSSLGGGLFVIDSLSDISQCSMMDNVVFDTLLDPELVDPDVYTEATIPGAGGGIYSFNTRALISDCQITHNAVGDSGGGLYLGGHPESIFYYDGMLATSTVRNCLITGNSAGQHGGGVVFDWYAEGQILNSTIADNAVGVLGGYGGGLYVGSEGHASVTDSIIWGNAGLNGSQIALGSSGNVSAMPAALDVVYSAIQDLEGADDIEVVFAVDTTEGMVDTITEIQNSILQIISRISGVAENYRVGIVGYRDPLGFSEYLYHDYSGLTDDPQQLLTAINFMITGGGSDLAATNPGAEAVYSGLMHCIDAASHNALLAANGAGHLIDPFSPGMDWSESRDVRKIIILIGDIGPRQPEENTDYMLGDVVAAANAKGITIWSIMTGNNFYRTPATDQYFANLATSTGGSLFEEPSNSMVVSTIMNAIGISGQIYNPLYVQPGSEMSGLDSNTGGWAESTHNIYTDPQFVLDYYLSQIDSGQLVDSNCVNAGSIDADELAVYIGHDVTTRTNHVPDSGTIAADGRVGRVDIGYHYDSSLPVEEYMLTIASPGVGGSIVGSWMGEDYGPGTYWLPQATQVWLYAVPDTVEPNTPAYIVDKWTGTDDDTSLELLNSVTVDGDKTVGVQFVLDVPQNRYVPGTYATIEQAVAAARSGDTVVLDEGTHYITNPAGIDFGGKALTLMSTDPDEPSVIAGTIIDCQGSRTFAKRAFHFHSGEGPDSKIIGVTIINGFQASAIGGIYPFGLPFPPDQTPNPAPIQAPTGQDAVGDGYGGAIFCENASSPTIENCVITKCIAAGGQGGDGYDGYYISGSQNRPGQSGGHGGIGSGDGYGGGIACIGASNPIVRNCTFVENSAEGGSGGDGGNGSARSPDSSGNGSWGGDGGNASGDGRGGAIYSDTGSSPSIVDCTFTDNYARTGSPGTGGAVGEGANWPAPWGSPSPGFDGTIITFGASSGGALYYGYQSDAHVVDTKFHNNEAFNILFSQQLIFSGDNYTYETVEVPMYTKGGAVYSDPNNTVALERCEFVENIGGAVYCNDDSDVDLVDCLFRDNKSRDDQVVDDFYYFYYYNYDAMLASPDVPGGALYLGAGSDVDIDECTFVGNYSHGDGGAINCKTDATFRNSAFAANVAYGDGGAIDTHNDYEPESVPAVDFYGCTFASNQGKLGGAVHLRKTTGEFADCYFVENIATNGGALYAVDNSTMTVTSGMISGNIATDKIGIGGGAACVDSTAIISNCILQDNVAEGANASGGAVSFYGGNPLVSHLIENCLLTDNSSANVGGAISASLFTEPEITNCTFANNHAGNFGGGVFCDWSSDPSITNSIFDNCDNYAVYEEEIGGDSGTTQSLFHNNPDGDYYDAAAGQGYTGAAQINTLPGNQSNIEGDPLFVMGGPFGETVDADIVSGPYYHYYLDPISPAVDAGSESAADAGLDMYTTDNSGLLDSGPVDLGHHHPDPAGVDKYELTAASKRGHGSVDPSSGLFYPGTMVKLVAIPDPGYRVTQWYGEDADGKVVYEATVNYASRSLDNAAIMLADRNIIVEFDQPRILVVGNAASEDNYYTTIQHAIEDAEDGDVVMVLPGTYRSSSGDWPLWALTFYGKSITLTSTNPDDSDTVAATILELFYLNIDNVGAEGLIEGFTITRSTTHLFNSDLTIRNCVFTGSNWRGMDGRNGGNPSSDGFDGVDIYGGAMRMYDSSPTILNCVFSNNSATGGDGGDGSNGGGDHGPGYDGGWSGRAYGGAVYCGFTSSPLFRDCVFTDNFAQGGNGGDGGNGVQRNHGGRGGTWQWAPSYEEEPLYWYWWDGWDFGDKYYDAYSFWSRYDWDQWNQWFHWDKFTGWEDFMFNWVYDPYDSRYDYWEYSGYGGAVYGEYGSNMKFEGCTFENNASYGGVSGIGGTVGPRIPWANFNIETAGGAIYAADQSSVEMINCVLNNNLADTSTDLPLPPENQPDPTNEPDDYYVSFGGGIASEDDSAIKLTDCIVSNNTACLGGGIYSSVSTVTVDGTDFEGNKAYHGGGLNTIYSTGTVTDSAFTDNMASFRDSFRTRHQVWPTVGIFGEGAGYYCFSSVIDISDSVFKENIATASGGGIYYGGSDQDLDFAPSLDNCLIRDNSASRDGGGISVNWFAEPTIANCTIVDNVVTGSWGEGTGFGGGLSTAYSSNTTIVNSIIWNNVSDSGAQIAVGTGNIYGPMPSVLDITYCDIGPAFDPNLVKFDLEIAFTDTASQTYSGPKLAGEQEIYDRFNAGQSTVKVIVTLAGPTTSAQPLIWQDPESLDIFRQEVTQAQGSVLSSLGASEFTLEYEYENIAAFSGEVTIAGLNQLLDDPAVATIEPVRYCQPVLAQAIPLANAMAARQAFDGTGVAIAIVDTGVDYTHPMLGGGTFPNSKVIGGYDTGVGDADPIAVGNAHGTACAGIAAGDLGIFEDYIGGVAPGAKIYALKATPDDSGSFPSSATLAAWDWCITHRHDDPANPIVVMSNSWGMPGTPFNNSAAADAYSPAMTSAAANATEAGITILAASGNDGFAGQGISWPSAMSDVISVGAVFDTTDAVTDYSNTAEILDILAPADPMYTTDIVAEGGYTPGDYMPTFNGTSSACPFAAGVVASLQSAAFSKTGTYLSHQKVREVLVATGDPVTDSKVDITKPRVNLGAALSGGMTFGPPVYIEDGCVVNGEIIYDFEPNSFVWGLEAFIIEQDPLLIGDYFLSHIAAGQLVDSPGIDIGNDMAANLGMDSYTTRTDSVVDVNTVDLGFHHTQFEVLQYHLDVMVTDVENAPAIEFTLDPAGGDYNQYRVVKISVTPPPGYGDDALQQFQVRWSGTDDDMVAGPENYVTMDVDKTVHVTYTPRYYLTYTFDPVAELPGFSPVLTPPSGYKDKDTIVELSVDIAPDPNLYRIAWTGTDDDTSVQLFNAVSMDSDRQVAVTFQPKETRYYAVVCGIANYAYETDIRWAVNDAEQFYRKLRLSANWNPQALDNPDNIVLLTDSEATKTGILAAIMEMADRADDDDVFVFYFAGHGTTSADDPDFGDERDALDECLVTYASQNISDDEMSQWLSSENLPTRDYLVILDTSFYGANSDLVLSPRGIGLVAPDMGDGFAEDMVRVSAETPDEEVGIVLSACSADQLAWENVTLRHGVFTNYLLESMESGSGADLFDPAGWISTREVYLHAKESVDGWMVQNADKFEDLIGLQVTVRQTVQTNDTGHDGPIDFFNFDEITLQQRTLSVPADYPTIQSAVEGARPGDLIIVSSGFYDGRGLVIDKEVTITGTNPDDADVVAATVIYVGQSAGSGITFATTAGSKTVLNGVTVAGDSLSVWVAANGADGDNLSPDGQDGSPAEGGGIYCSYGSSPTISNCVIENFHIAGGNGGNGADISQDNLIAGRGGWGGWARGGGVYIAEYSSPTLIHCEIRNCSATGGSGGNGGGGGGGEESAGLGGLWTNDTDATWQALGYEGQYRFYSGYGGGVYCGQFSSPEFIACTISNNATQGGMSGIGGNAGDGTVQQPDVSYEIPSYGGGIYCAEKSDVTFEGCSITSNVAAKPSEVYHLSSSLGHGGGIAFESEASVSFSAYELSSGGKMECLIGENTASVGGGVYFAGADAWITDCNVINNLAFQGAGIYGANLFDIYGKARIQNCTIQNNFAGSVIIETPEPDDPTIGDVDIVAGQGAGIYCDSVPAQIVDNKFNNNVATASGGGIYITGATLADPNVINCLIVNNQAGRDGGGISANWHAAPRISSCTISDNEAVGDFGPISSSGVGGGLYCGYFAEAETIDSIFWNNAAALGRQIAVGSGFEFDPRPGVLTLSYSDVHGGLGEPATYVEGDPATMLPGSHDGVINADPLFATGSLGDYYLSQTAAGQSPQSPCVDAGSDFAIRLFASYRLYTTSTNDAFGAYDIGWVDMGYHYRFKETEHRCRHIDLVRDGVIRLEDFALVALHWMDDFCAYPGWCDGADTNADEYVDSDDLVTFARCWLVEDNEAPQPDPSVWLTKPYGVNGATGQIAMTAGESYDSWGWDVAYYFERLVGPIGDPGNPNSGWQWRGNTTNPTMWTDSGLTPYEQYSYVFKVGEVRADNGTNVTVIGNETQYAPKAFAIAGDEINPPQPNPSQWSLLPVSASATSITMAAVVATDFEGSGVEYYFENQTIVGEDHDSGWQDDPFYTDEGLTTGVLYTYRVVTRDKSYNQNQGSYSVSASAMPEEGAVTDTMPPYPTGGFAGDPGDPDAIPPIPYAPPDPPQWLSFYKQDSGQDTYLILEAVPATDTLSMPVQYMFVSKTSNHPSTGWLDVNIHAVLLSSWVEYGSFTIKYRDSALPVSNESVESEEWDTTMIP